ncbi:hypothetical protein HanIR_Chr04g0163941 [Helianthus annuus]|nr:hypothetical protein HanIR_Chr04g0163941 [Helianthus annuus]
MCTGWHVLKPKKSLVMPIQDRSKSSLWGSPSLGRRHIKSTALAALFFANPLIKLASLLTPPRSFTPTNGLLMSVGNNPSRKLLPSQEGQTSLVFLIFSSRPNLRLITLMMSNTLATSSESLMTVPSSRYQA